MSLACSLFLQQCCPSCMWICDESAAHCSKKKMNKNGVVKMKRNKSRTKGRRTALSISFVSNKLRLFWYGGRYVLKKSVEPLRLKQLMSLAMQGDSRITKAFNGWVQNADSITDNGRVMNVIYRNLLCVHHFINEGMCGDQKLSRGSLTPFRLHSISSESFSSFSRYSLKFHPIHFSFWFQGFVKTKWKLQVLESVVEDDNWINWHEQRWILGWTIFNTDTQSSETKLN